MKSAKNNKQDENQQKMAQGPATVSIAPKHGVEVGITKLVNEGFQWGSAIIKAVIVIAVFTLTLIYVITPISVSGISMQPTLHTGNVMLVYKWPQTWARLTGTQYIPSRTNIIIIAKNPVSNEQLIKRVIALPGEKVIIDNNYLTIYNQNNPQGLNPDNARQCTVLHKIT